MWHGCPRNPLYLLFATHPLLVMMSNIATSGDIVGLHFLLGGQLITQALTDGSLNFYRNMNKLNNGYVFPQIMDLFGRNNKIYTIIT